MLFLIIGVLLLLLKYLEIPPVAAWEWWVVLAPFGLAAAWWAYADWSGLTKRRAVERMERRKHDRIEKQRQHLGLGPRRTR